MVDDGCSIFLDEDDDDDDDNDVILWLFISSKAEGQYTFFESVRIELLADEFSFKNDFDEIVNF